MMSPFFRVQDPTVKAAKRGPSVDPDRATQDPTCSGFSNLASSHSSRVRNNGRTDIVP